MQPTKPSQQTAAAFGRVATRRIRPELGLLLTVCGAGVVGAISYMGWKLATDADLRRRPTGRFTFSGRKH
ncbi:hypothetical protein THASP1DRAFT_29649 [Thamnocephalis sphaerospora]|uniref:Uncharacterized protein n=1 Tax=Thamnocephalis sphaerospora TaxID=78915 RepID=A0A4P9XR53_9FUNG|nr:hypothetical protein THASP1DRAFT_29649 [Thamnocephalis sphaerospora]|eukprot:RKP08557.1 hypothetical protein THASP1DRAFT_29649 [Thamnocephalis sphaerospora]